MSFAPGALWEYHCHRDIAQNDDRPFCIVRPEQRKEGNAQGQISRLRLFLTVQFKPDKVNSFHKICYLAMLQCPGNITSTVRSLTNMERIVERELEGETEVLGENLPKYHFFHYK
jgi:hypothetical protein